MSGREKKPLRQHSLDCGIKIPLRRQISEDIISKTAIQAGRQLKIAWTVEKIEPESEQVEIIAKKCGQPKPKPAVKPPRSPFAPDQNTVLFSRQQLTERLRSSWQKNSGSRHNLDIFLNRSVESENSDTGGSLPRTPDDSESSENEEEISRCIPPNGGSPVPAQSTPLPPPQITYQSDQTDTPKLCASARRMNFRNMGRQRSILESPCPTPEPGKATPTFKNINRQRVGDSSSSCASTPEPRKQLTRMMSAPPRSLPPSSRKLVKAPSMETPLLSPNQRVKSAPPKRKLRSAKKRTNGKHVGQDTSDDDGDGNAKGQGGGKRGARRGVDRGEVVTMVSLVSPAGTDSDEPTCIALPFPTPKQSASSTPVPKEELKPTPPPPIICLRKPLKSVTFRPSIAGSPPTVSQYHTNFALRKSAVLTHQTSLPVQSTVASTGGHYKVQTKLNQSSRQTLQRTVTHQQSSSTKAHSTVIRKRVGLQDHGKFQHPIKEVAEKDVVPIISSRSNSVESTVTITSTTTTVVTTVAGNSQRCNINNVAVTTTVPCSTPLISPAVTTAATTTTTTVASITSNDTEESDPSKPNFKSSKEKECWDLFKKMSDKGVSVSFETVLRGLLTPTEYRMRKAALLSVC